MPATNSVDVDLGARLIELRLQYGLTLSTLAPFAKMTEAELEAAEQGLQRLSATQIFNLCQTLNIRPADLYRSPDSADALEQSPPFRRGLNENRL